MIRNASRQRKNTNGRLKHYQKIWTLLSKVFLMIARLSKKVLEVSPSKYIPKMNKQKLYPPKGAHNDKKEYPKRN